MDDVGWSTWRCEWGRVPDESATRVHVSASLGGGGDGGGGGRGTKRPRRAALEPELKSAMLSVASPSHPSPAPPSGGTALAHSLWPGWAFLTSTPALTTVPMITDGN